MYDFKPPCIDPQNDKSKTYKAMDFTQYKIKIYDKSLQNKKSVGARNILRVEIKYKGAKILRKMGVKSIIDLKDKEVLMTLMEDFMIKLQKLLIIDSFDGGVCASKEDRNRLIKYTNPTFWADLRGKIAKKESHRNTLTYHKKRCQELMQKYNLTTTRTHIFELLRNKYEELMLLNTNDITLTKNNAQHSDGYFFYTVQNQVV